MCCHGSGSHFYLSMFGYDDELDILMEKPVDPNVTRLITLDKSQSGCKTEQNLIAMDKQKNLGANTHFVIGQSARTRFPTRKGSWRTGRWLARAQRTGLFREKECLLLQVWRAAQATKRRITPSRSLSTQTRLLASQRN